MRFFRLLRRLRGHEGMSLVMAVGVLGVLSVSGSSVVYYTSSSVRTAQFSKQNASAYDLAEAGINEMVSILNNSPQNNAFNEYLLGKNPDGTLTKTVHTYDTGTVTWWGTLDKTLGTTATWSLTSVGAIKNATGAAGDVTRTITAKVPVYPVATQELTNPAWNYIFSWGTGRTCDMTIDNTVSVKTRLYVAGNLCLSNQGNVAGDATNPGDVSLVVQGNLTMHSNQNYVGQSGSPLGSAQIGQGCKYNGASAFRNPCKSGAQTPGDNIWALNAAGWPSTPGDVGNTPPALTRPAADFDNWYLNASPGPFFPCQSSGGTPPTWDNNQNTASPSVATMDRSVSGSFNLTPTSSYKCETAAGKILWNATTTDSPTYGPARTLTINGTMFIDGNARIEPPSGNVTYQYNGQATLYLRGTFVIKNTNLCGSVSGSSCDFSSWNPNTEMLTIVADGDGTGVTAQNDLPANTSIELKNASFQGALYASHNLQLDTTSRADGPMVAKEVVLGQSIATDSFTTIQTVPAGMPGTPLVVAQPDKPQLYSG